MTVVPKHILLVFLLGLLSPFLAMLLRTLRLLSWPCLQIQHQHHLLLPRLPPAGRGPLVQVCTAPELFLTAAVTKGYYRGVYGSDSLMRL